MPVSTERPPDRPLERPVQQGGGRMLVAFATTDLVTVDAHFGTAPRFLLCVVDAARSARLGEVRFQAADEDGDHGKLGPRLGALDGCALLFAAAVGPSAVAQLASRGVRAAPARPGEAIDELLARLVRLLAGAPPPWLRRAAGLPPANPDHEAARAAGSEP